MTPLEILDDEICRKVFAVKYHHKSFQDALFRPDETASPLCKQFHIMAEVRVKSAKGLVHANIEHLRLLQRIKERIQYAARVNRGERV